MLSPQPCLRQNASARGLLPLTGFHCLFGSAVSRRSPRVLRSSALERSVAPSMAAGAEAEVEAET